MTRRSTIIGIIGIINLSNPDQGNVCKITSSAPLKGQEITNGLLAVWADSQAKHDLNKCVGEVIKLVLRT